MLDSIRNALCVVEGAGTLFCGIMGKVAAAQEEKMRQENEKKEWEQKGVAHEKEVARKNRLVSQVFEDIKGELKGQKSITRTLRQFGVLDLKHSAKSCDRLYAELKDGIKAFIVADNVIGDVPEFPKVLSVSSSEEFSRFCMKYPNLPGISFIAFSCGTQPLTEDCYKVKLLRHVAEHHIGTEVRLAKFELNEDKEQEGAGEHYITAELVDFKKWVVQTQKNVSRIIDLFNRHIQGEDISSLMPSNDNNEAADKETISPSRQTNSRTSKRRSAPKRGARLDLSENSITEFKTSIIFSPENNQPSPSQPQKIAQELAGFMNKDGGDLYLGVNDSGCVVGIQDDLDHLQEAEICGQNGRTDRSYTYRPSHDGYSQKLQNIARFFLGEMAATLLDDPEFIHDDIADVDYVKLHVRPSLENFVYCGQYEDVYVRSNTSVARLKGADREKYARDRFKRD